MTQGARRRTPCIRAPKYTMVRSAPCSFLILSLILEGRRKGTSISTELRCTFAPAERRSTVLRSQGDLVVRKASMWFMVLVLLGTISSSIAEADQGRGTSMGRRPCPGGNRFLKSHAHASGGGLTHLEAPPYSR